MDRDAKFSEAFPVILGQAGVEAVRLPARSPNLNPNLEHFIRSVKEECLERMVFFGERSLQTAVAGAGDGGGSQRGPRLQGDKARQDAN
jgi:putative transposase